MKKTQQIKHLINATKLLVDSGIWPKTPRAFHYWWDMVRFAHERGYLYLGFNGMEVNVVAIGYRVKNLTPDIGSRLPTEEAGTTLYVPVVVSKSGKSYRLMKLLSYYREHNEINRIAYRWRGKHSDLRTHTLRGHHGAR